MRYPVASLSTAILDCLDTPGPLGSVHSVFDHALNIRLQSGSRIVAATFPGAGRLPYAWMLADPSAPPFSSAGLSPGMQVYLAGPGRVEIPLAGVSIDYDDAEPWSPLMAPLSNPQDTHAFLELIDWATSTLHEKAHQAGLAPLLGIHHPVRDGMDANALPPEQAVARLAVPTINHLLRALQADDPASIGTAVKGLIGYGIGGTPSGDDLLVGMLAAMQRCTHPEALQSHLRLRTALGDQLSEDSTSLLSLTVIRHALADEFSEKIHEVTRQLMHPDSLDALQTSLERLLMHGATSGSEMLLGLSLGYQVLFPD